jgi:hypothetical protein
MLVTNQTTSDYWFGPLHLPAGVGQTLTVDDTSATSLYLISDSVADAINNLVAAGKITVSSAAAPFPRFVGTPDVIHGDGSPEGLIYAGPGSVYLRRDKPSMWQKSTGIHVNTGWVVNPQLFGLSPLAPAAAASETISRADCDADTNVLVSAQLVLQSIVLPLNSVITSATFVSGATAAGTPVNQWFALYDQNLNKLGVTSDDTSTAWAASSAKTLTFASQITTAYSGLFYLGVMVKATTVPSILGFSSRLTLNALAPKLTGTSTAALTNPASAPATAAALTAVGATLYGYVS